MTAGELLTWVSAIALSIVIVVITITIIVRMLRSLRRPSNHSMRSTNIMKGPER